MATPTDNICTHCLRPGHRASQCRVPRDTTPAPLLPVDLSRKCGTCVHAALPAHEDPCEACLNGVNRPMWEAA